MQIYARIVKGCGLINLSGSLRQKMEKDTKSSAKAAITDNIIEI